MALCGSGNCRCALQSSSLTITGDGSAGTPWVIEGASPMKITNAQRLALSGGDLFAGLMVWTTDVGRMWIYHNSLWTIVGGSMPTLNLRKTSSQSILTSTTVDVFFSTGTTEIVDTDGFFGSTGDVASIPAALGGDYSVSGSARFEANLNGGRRVLLDIVPNTVEADIVA